MTERGLLAIAEALFAIADALKPEEKPKATRAKSAKTPPPEDLTLEDKRELKAWAERNEPWAVPRLRELVDDMLQWHRASAVSRASWYITAQRWITNARVKHGEDKPRKAEQSKPPAQKQVPTRSAAELRAEIEAAGDRVLAREEAQALITDMMDRATKRLEVVR